MTFLAKMLAIAKPSKRPPKKWWDKMYKKVSEGNPSYTDEMIRATIGKIWYHNLSPAKIQEIKRR